MEITELPFHKLLQITVAEAPYIYQMHEQEMMLNHVGAIHACIQLTLAEASAGEFLKRELWEYQHILVPVVRKTEAKYSKPAKGLLKSKVTFVGSDQTEILNWAAEKTRFQIQTKVILSDESDQNTLTVVFDWFIQKINP